MRGYRRRVSQQPWQPTTPQPGPQGPYQAMPNQGYGAAPQPRGTIRLTIQGSVLTSNMITPSIILDGQHLPSSQYGVNMLPVYPGRHRIDMYAQWLRQYGQASLEVDVPAGGFVDVFYAAPLHQFATGSIGFQKQQAKGKGVFFGLLSGLLAIPLLIIILSLLTS